MNYFIFAQIREMIRQAADMMKTNATFHATRTNDD